MKVNPDDLAGIVERCLNDYVAEVSAVKDAAVEEVAKDTVDELGRLGSYGGSKYRKSFSYRLDKRRGITIGTVHSKAPFYRLAHLLEHGHATRNGGRTRAFPHWAPAEKSAAEALGEKMRRGIEAIRT